MLAAHVLVWVVTAELMSLVSNMPPAAPPARSVPPSGIRAASQSRSHGTGKSGKGSAHIARLLLDRGLSAAEVAAALAAEGAAIQEGAGQQEGHLTEKGAFVQEGAALLTQVPSPYEAQLAALGLQEAP